MKKVLFILAVAFTASCSSPKGEGCCAVDSTKKDSIIVKIDSTKIVVDSVVVDSTKK